MIDMAKSYGLMAEMSSKLQMQTRQFNCIETLLFSIIESHPV